MLKMMMEMLLNKLLSSMILFGALKTFKRDVTNALETIISNSPQRKWDSSFSKML